LRRELPALTDPRLDRVQTEYDQDAGWIIVRRGPVVVASNLGARNWIFPVDPSARLLAASAPSVERAQRHITLPPDTVAILNT
jgi:maltooligosyltrehalose trehalohydrolase